jgi:hypothetical protein
MDWIEFILFFRLLTVRKANPSSKLPRHRFANSAECKIFAEFSFGIYFFFTLVVFSCFTFMSPSLTFSNRSSGRSPPSRPSRPCSTSPSWSRSALASSQASNAQGTLAIAESDILRRVLSLFVFESIFSLSIALFRSHMYSFFGQSGLTQDALAQIWTMADVSGDGRLDLKVRRVVDDALIIVLCYAAIGSFCLQSFNRDFSNFLTHVQEFCLALFLIQAATARESIIMPLPTTLIHSIWTTTPPNPLPNALKYDGRGVMYLFF